MVYESEIQFTLDTICPWTYLAKRRLDRALDQIPSDAPVRFSVKYLPYQLYPAASQAGEDKYEWYKKSKYDDSEEKMKMYTTLMSAYGATEAIEYKFGGTVANTLQAHRLIQHFQEVKGVEVADKIVNSLYRQYFEEEKHPSSSDTLLRAAMEAGISDTEAQAFIDDEDEGLMDVKMLIREQAGNGIDSVPYIVIEGKRRDLTLVGAKEVGEYTKALNQVIKESG
ncbi:thioredoxin-like protein [Hortaea werneckii]|uniref:DSBA-like thioredoxin domain-containing protein n=1 Tax=Hortaea werneckii TaxID=91943 RepID=A0A3M7GAT1_HORWE|nr:thioredoxin-like protein [Hortaea werneckii]KAI7204724.1 thioredoxin-like protein [Hortaea werneckii]KAI7562787.1 thioredoxin-like protein [Hortaea werneckii]KAI7627251.1 thioredoxin-like protein [Hortaea werneckii]KAI7637156.1 thioredoxin-like protein [Hortaea werneckii]